MLLRAGGVRLFQPALAPIPLRHLRVGLAEMAIRATTPSMMLLVCGLDPQPRIIVGPTLLKNRHPLLRLEEVQLLCLVGRRGAWKV